VLRVLPGMDEAAIANLLQAQSSAKPEIMLGSPPRPMDHASFTSGAARASG
jgi:hypothetical protein